MCIRDSVHTLRVFPFFLHLPSYVALLVFPRYQSAPGLSPFSISVFSSALTSLAASSSPIYILMTPKFIVSTPLLSKSPTLHSVAYWTSPPDTPYQGCPARGCAVFLPTSPRPLSLPLQHRPSQGPASEHTGLCTRCLCLGRSSPRRPAVSVSQ